MSAPPSPPTLREWVRDHDEKWLFVILYLGLAVVLSVFVSLFWLVVVALLHFALECIRQRHYRRGPKQVVLHALWEVKLDVGLVLLALTLVLYIEVVLGLLGIQSAARASTVSRIGVRVGSRAAAWERNLRTLLLTFDEMVRVAGAAVTFRKKRRAGARGEALERDALAEVVEGMEDPVTVAVARPDAEIPKRVEKQTGAAEGFLLPAWRESWKTGDYVALALVVGGVTLICAAPLLTPHDWGSAALALLAELQPLP